MSQGQIFDPFIIFFKLVLRNFIGDSLIAYDELEDSHLMTFTTFDCDRDDYSGVCTDEQGGGWWYGKCVSQSNLNGRYGCPTLRDGIYWHGFDGGNCLKSVEMKIKALNNEE